MRCGDLVLKLLQVFDCQKFPYTYLRNFENLPDDVGNDVDLLVPAGMRTRAAEMIASSLNGTGWFLIRQVEFGPLSLFFVNDALDQFMHIDLFDRIEWHWLEYANAPQLIERRQWNGMIHHPSIEDEIVINILTRLFYAGAVREKHQQQAATYLRKQPADVLIAAFGAHLGTKSGTLVAAHVVRQDWHGLTSITTSLRRALYQRALFRLPVASALMGFWRYLRRATLRLLRPPGPFLVFEGADGVGKSIIMERIVPMMKGLTGRNDTLMFHWKPALNSIHIAGESAAPPQNPCGKTSRSMALSLLFLGYHWLGFWTGYLRHVLPARARNCAVIGDRYAYEFFLDPARLRLNLPQWLLRIASATVPQPDLVLCLVADPAAVIARKPELSEAEITRYQRDLTFLTTGSNRFSLLQAGGSIEENIHTARARILSCLYSSK